MTIQDFLADLRHKNVKLWVEGDRLRLNAPKDVLTLALRTELAERKAEILAFLQTVEVKNQPALPLQPIPRNQDLPLSFAQQRLWLFNQLEPNSSVYNIPTGIRFEGDIQLTALEQSLNEVVRRHEALRTTFSVNGQQPVQQIWPPMSCPLEVIDLRPLPPAEREVEAWRLATAEAQRPFDLAQAPLIRAVLLRLAEQEQLLLVTSHHIASDGWSIGVLIRELSALYPAFCRGEPSSLPDLPIQYADFAYWQRQWLSGDVLETQLNYWKQHLHGPLPVLELPTDHPRPAVQTFNGANQFFTLPDSLVEGIKTLSRQTESTLFMILLAAFETLLFRYTGQADLVIGTPVANRNRVEIEKLIGFFVNTLVLRTDLSGNPSFRELVKRIREVALGAYAHQDLPFELLVETLQPQREASRSPLFQVMFVFEKALITPLNVDNGTSKFDLSLYMWEEAGRLTGMMEYNTDLFEATTINRMINHLQMLLTAVVAQPDCLIYNLPLLTEAERQQILVEWNQPPVDYSSSLDLIQLIEAQVECTPHAVAVVFENASLTYQELNRRANQLAQHLQTLGVAPDVLVGIFMERSLDMVVALLAVLKAGGAYLPLDPMFPSDRLAYMLADSQARVLLTQHRLLPTAPEHQAQVVCIDADWPAIARHCADNLTPTAAPTHLAYVLYTSGSTGRPKGVQIERRALLNFLLSMRQQPGLSAEDVLLAVTTLSFDIAGLELFLPLLVGARLVIVSSATAADGVQLLQQLITSGATVMQATPATWRLLLAAGWSPNLPLKILCGGEALPRDLAEQLLHRGQVWNLYGPTETTIWSTVHHVTSGTGPVSIGRPIANTQVYILDPQLQPVPVGVMGEFYIGGAGLARGYLNRPDLTAEKFIRDPFSPEPGRRLYRTGDLVRYRPDGDIDFMGRVDFQVKVRGYRIELGEIEAVLVQHPAIHQAVVVVQEYIPGDERLAAYLIPAATDNPQKSETSTPPPVFEAESLRKELRHFLKQSLPDYMIPSAFVFLEAFPLTPNGKINRRELPLPDWAGIGPDNKVAPHTPLEEVLAGIWTKVLGAAEVGIHDNFFESGGYSLLAAQLISRVRETFQVELPLRVIFEAPTVAGLAEQIEQARRTAFIPAAPPILPVSRRQPLPLSFAQQRLWFLDQLERGSHYNIPIAATLQGSLNIKALEQSLTEMVRRHEVLRTVFQKVNGQPVQIIRPAQPFGLSIVDLQTLPEAEREVEAQRLVAAEAGRLFDLAQDLLLRATLIRLDDTRYIFLLTMHHIVSDIWSIAILSRELAALYQAFSAGQPSPLPELPIQYADYTYWQRQWLQGEVLAAQVTYWKQQLGGTLPVLRLPTDRPRPAVQTFRGATQSLALSPDLTAKLKTLSFQEESTLFMTLLAAFKTLLYRYTGQTDLLVGSPIANRSRGEVEDLIGFFLNTLVLRTQLSDRLTFRELLRQVRQTAIDAYAHQDLPFEILVDELHLKRDMSYNPLFQVMFTLENVPFTLPEPIPELNNSIFSVGSGTAKFDLTLFLRDTPAGLVGAIEYSTDLFDAATITRLIGHFQTLLEGITANPNECLSTLPLLSQAEQRQLLVDWNATQADYPAHLCVHQLFEYQVEQTPTAIAVDFPSLAPANRENTKQLTYQELNHRANRLAHHLRRLGVGPDVLVGIHMERSLEMVISVLAVLKAGGAYVSLDPSYPPERLAFMIQDTRTPVLLTQQRLAGALPVHHHQVICLDAAWPALAGESTTNPTTLTTPDNLAYVIYTSGSTGQPKGVAMGHRPLVNLISWQLQHTLLSEGAKTLQFASLSFDVSFQELFSTWCSGGSLTLISEEMRRDMAALVRFLADQSIERMFLPFIALQQLAEVIDQQGPVPYHLKEIMTAGEQLQITPALAELMKKLNQCVLYNQYGPSESHVVTALTLAYPPDYWPKLPPIGRPIANCQIYILDAQLQPTPIGVPGELYIGGVGLAHGYLYHPELTAEKFIPNPFGQSRGAEEQGNRGATFFPVSLPLRPPAPLRLYKTGDLARYLPDGNIEFLGRLDHQVKIRGFRVELGEIETVLNQHPAILESVVTAQADASGSKRLVAYIVSDPQQSLSAADLREALKPKLPDYMIPSVFMFLKTLPLTPSGKISRQALPAPEIIRSNSDTPLILPRNEIERQLTHMWEELLGVRPVGVTDDFFELGGHSLLAVRMFAQIEQQFHTNLPLATLFQGATVEQVGQAIQQQGGLKSWSCLVKIQPDGSKPPFFCVHGGTGDVLWFRELAHYLGPDQPFYGLQSRGLDGLQAPLTRIEEMAECYINEIRTVQPEGPYFIGGYCFGGTVAFEMARQLQAQGQQVAFLAILSTLAPYTGYRTDIWRPTFLIDFLKNIPYWLLNLYEIGPQTALARIHRRWRVLKKRLTTKHPEREAADIIENGFQLPEHRRRIIEYNDRAAAMYIPQLYNGRLFDFQPRIPPLFQVPHRRTGWANFATQGVTVILIAGSHQSIFKEPRVLHLANQLRSCLDKAQTPF